MLNELSERPEATADKLRVTYRRDSSGLPISVIICKESLDFTFNKLCGAEAIG